jgi:hypothetical protein
MERRQRCEILLHHPGKAGVRHSAARLGQCRHLVDDVAERGGLDEQYFAHAAFAGLI